MGKILRHGLGALIGAILGGIVTVLIGHGVEIDPEKVGAVAETLTNGAVLFVTVFGYAVVEKFLKRFPSIDLEGWIDRTWLKREAKQASPPRL